MSTSTPSNFITRPSPGYIATADEALDVMASVQYALADSVRSSLIDRLSEGAGIVSKMLAVSGISKRAKEFTDGPFVPVSYQSLKNVPRTENDLKALFNHDGPRLGSSISEGEEILAEVVGLGAGLKASTVFPFLTETRDEKGQLISGTFEWLSQQQISERLAGSLSSGNSDFPLASTSLKKDNSLTITFTDFSKYGVVRPELTSLAASFSKISQIVDDLRGQLVVLVANTAKSAEQLELMVDRLVEAGKLYESRQNIITEKFKAELTETLRKMRLLKIEKYVYDEKIEKLQLETSGVENSANPDKEKGRSLLDTLPLVKDL